MRRALSAIGFVLTLSVAASSFASLLGTDANNPEQNEQSFLIPRSASPGADECLADQSECGNSAAASICESRGFSRVVSFGEASPEDMTGSIDIAGQKTPAAQSETSRNKPFLITCSK